MLKKYAAYAKIVLRKRGGNGELPVGEMCFKAEGFHDSALLIC